MERLASLTGLARKLARPANGKPFGGSVCAAFGGGVVLLIGFSRLKRKFALIYGFFKRLELVV
jgi:hypothetical protein